MGRKLAPADRKGGKGKGAAKEKCAKQGNRKSKDKGSWGHLGGDLEAELAQIGLRVKDVTADGNCFFRACSDQLQGDESLYGILRAKVVAHIAANGDNFRPFVEDDEPLETYLKRMGKEGTWAGHMELVAASQVLQASIAVYQAGQPRWTVEYETPEAAPSSKATGSGISSGPHNAQVQPSKAKKDTSPAAGAAAAPRATPAAATGPCMLHLSYHDGMHYSSVRMADDFSHGCAPEPVVLGAARAVGTGVDGEGGCGRPAPSADERKVARSTGCWDPAVIARCLEEADHDVDAAIEAVISWMAGNAEGAPVGEEETEGQGTGQTSTGGVEGAGGAVCVETLRTQAEIKGGASSAVADRMAACFALQQQHAVCSSIHEPMIAAPCTLTDSEQGVSGGQTAQSEDSGTSVWPCPEAAPLAPVPGAAASKLHQTDSIDAHEADIGGAGSKRSGSSSDGGNDSSDASQTGSSGGAPVQPVVRSSTVLASVVNGAHGVGCTDPSVPPTANIANPLARAGPKATTGRSSKVKVLGCGNNSSGGSSKAPSNNKKCPCGSNKKFKNCCGTAISSAKRARKGRDGEVPSDAKAMGGSNKGQLGDVNQPVVMAHLASLSI